MNTEGPILTTIKVGPRAFKIGIAATPYRLAARLTIATCAPMKNQPRTKDRRQHHSTNPFFPPAPPLLLLLLLLLPEATDSVIDVEDNFVSEETTKK
jgi:hypothetical protein